MADIVRKVKISDPDNIPETLCDGRFNIQSNGTLATLTFTHARARPDALFNGTVIVENVIRARITLTYAALIALRDVLNAVVDTANKSAPAAGISSPTSKH